MKSAPSAGEVPIVFKALIVIPSPLVPCLAFFNGRYLATGSRDKTARLWDVRTGAQRCPPLRHEKAVNVVAFSPGGRLALTAGDDNTARLWVAATGAPRGAPMRHRDTGLMTFGHILNPLQAFRDALVQVTRALISGRGLLQRRKLNLDRPLGALDPG